VNPRVISQFKYDEKAGAADATLYSMFRFPESSEVHFQCDIAVCKGKRTLGVSSRNEAFQGILRATQKIPTKSQSIKQKTLM